MKYEDKTNRWIAIEVAKRLGKRVSTVTEFHEGDGCVVYPHNNQINFDPCNNPSDAWPIIIDNKISISHSIALYRADALVYDKKFDNGFKIFNQDSQLGDTSSGGALRAAMICFLKMKDAQQ